MCIYGRLGCRVLLSPSLPFTPEANRPRRAPCSVLRRIAACSERLRQARRAQNKRTLAGASPPVGTLTDKSTDRFCACCRTDVTMSPVRRCAYRMRYSDPTALPGGIHPSTAGSQRNAAGSVHDSPMDASARFASRYARYALRGCAFRRRGPDDQNRNNGREQVVIRSQHAHVSPWSRATQGVNRD